MTRRFVTAPALALLLAGCASASSPPRSDSPSQECAVRLPPRSSKPAAASPAAERTAAPSQLVVHVEAPLAPLKQRLEQRIPERLSEGRVGIGPGGTVTYTVTRGALSLRVTASTLRVETPVRAQAEACRGSNCYASCEPEATAVAEVPLMLGADYRFQKASVSVDFTRGCKVRALGGLLTVDVTPTLQAQLQPELRKLAREIDAQLPDLRAHITEAWSELPTPRELPLGACFVLQPFAVVQGPFSPSKTTLSGRFAVQARPELRSSCATPLAPLALPALQTDPALPAEGVVHLGLVTPLDSLARAFTSAQPLEASNKHVRVAEADVAAHGSDVHVALALSGDVCGDLALGAALDFSGDGQHIGLRRPTLDPTERDRLVASQLDPPALTEALASLPRVTPLLSAQAFRDAVPALVTSLAPPSLQIQATVSEASAAGAIARGDELVAWIEARGAVRVHTDAL